MHKALPKSLVTTKNGGALCQTSNSRDVDKAPCNYSLFNKVQYTTVFPRWQ